MISILEIDESRQMFRYALIERTFPPTKHFPHQVSTFTHPPVGLPSKSGITKLPRQVPPQLQNSRSLTCWIVVFSAVPA